MVDVLTKTSPAQRGMKIPNRGREKYYRLLADLPAVFFSHEKLFFYVYELMEAERNGTFSFEIRPSASQPA